MMMLDVARGPIAAAGVSLRVYVRTFGVEFHLLLGRKSWKAGWVLIAMSLVKGY